MEKVTVEGIVLNETNYGETSKILNILTKEYGYISVMSKGSRVIKSKLRGISMKLVIARFTINYKENGISNLIEGSIINPITNILTNLEKMNYSIYLINLFKSILKDYNDTNFYSLLSNALIKINDNLNPLVITNIIEIKLLEYLGVKPNFLECVICGNQDVLTFDITKGGVVCSNCYQNTYIFKDKTLKLLKLFQDVDINKIDKIIISKETEKEINEFIKEYYETYTGIYLKNKDNLKNVYQIT